MRGAAAELGLHLAKAKSGEAVKAGPIWFAVVLVLGIACYFLFKSMSKHMRIVREQFPAEPAVRVAAASPEQPAVQPAVQPVVVQPAVPVVVQDAVPVVVQDAAEPPPTPSSSTPSSST